LTGSATLGTLESMSGLRAVGGDVERVLERVNVPSYVIDQTGVIRWVNPAAVQLVGDVRGKQFTSVVAPEDRRHAQDVFARKVAGTASVTDAEVVLMDADGERVLVEVSSCPLHRGEQMIGVFGQMKSRLEHPPLQDHPALTPRQGQVLRLLEQGRSTKQIAAELHLSPETVRNHIRHLMKTLDVHSRLEAVAIARHEHLLAAR
jgi:PAS domain S-box-containing protein